MAQPSVLTVHEPVTGTLQHIVADPATGKAVIIDPVLDYRKDTGTISTQSADELLQKVAEQNLEVTHILETHAHADHLSASRYLQHQLKASRDQGQEPLVCIGRRIQAVQHALAGAYNIPGDDFQNAFDHYFDDQEIFQVGNLSVKVIPLPGHTPDHVGYLIGDNVFTGDSIFNPDLGSARCDFPGGSATELYNSVQTLLNLPPHFQVYPGHDYPPAERKADGALPCASVREHRESNKHVKLGTREEDFVKWRTERDSTLAEPKLLKISMNVNLRGGRLPPVPVEGFPITSVPADVARIARL